MTRLLAVLLLGLVAAGVVADEYAVYNRVGKYDPYFRKYSKRFFGAGFDWRVFKAQAIADSRLKPDARSHVGAVGIMQIMPATFEEIVAKNPTIRGGRLQPRWNIAAGIFYDRQLWRFWKAERPLADRLNFMFSSYNAGKGNILKAQRMARRKNVNPNLWPPVAEVLPRVTGKRSRETLGYVAKIEKIKGVLR